MLTFIFFIFGLLVGSFLNAVIYRLYDGKSITTGRSECPHCNHPLAAADLVPVLSYLWLGGKCRYCHKPISAQYPIVELLTGVVFVLAFRQLGVSEFLFFNLVCLCLFIVIAVFDLKHYLILDRVVFIGVAVVMLQIIFASLFNHTGFFALGTPLVQGVIGAAIISGFFGLQYLVSSGRWIGLGDVKLGLFLGLIFGFGQSLMLLLLSYCSGAVVGLLLIGLGKRQLSGKLPFGTFLAFCGIIMLLYGKVLLSGYLGLLGF